MDNVEVVRRIEEAYNRTDWIQISRHSGDGTMVETWAQMDVPRLMTQLGAMPAMGGE